MNGAVRPGPALLTSDADSSLPPAPACVVMWSREPHATVQQRYEADLLNSRLAGDKKRTAAAGAELGQEQTKTTGC